MPHRLKITPEGMQTLLERLYARSIIADDYELIIAIVEAHVLVDDTLAEKQGTIMKLLRMLFGAKTEKKKTDHVVKPNTPKEKSKGHGRNGRASYTGSNKVTVAHPSLKSGDPCPNVIRGASTRADPPCSSGSPEVLPLRQRHGNSRSSAATCAGRCSRPRCPRARALLNTMPQPAPWLRF